MDELITINPTNEQFPISAQELHEKLELSSANWAKWHQINIQKNRFAIHGQDYIGFVLSTNGNLTQDYQLSIDFAKRLCMMAKTEKGEQIRRYFIEVEKRFKQLLPQAAIGAIDPQMIQTMVQAVLQSSVQPLAQSINDLKRNQQTMNNLLSFMAHQEPNVKTSGNLSTGDTQNILNRSYQGKYDQETLDIAFFREEACQAIIAARNDHFISKKDLGMIERAWAEELSLHIKYFYRLVKQYETEGFSALLPKERSDKGVQRSLCRFGAYLVKELYYAESRPNVSAIYNKALDKVKKLGPEFCDLCMFAWDCQQTDHSGIKVGSYATVSRYISTDLSTGLEEPRRTARDETILTKSEIPV